MSSICFSLSGLNSDLCCVICQEEGGRHFSVDQTGHSVHQYCLMQWIGQCIENGQPSLCPLCKKQITKITGVPSKAIDLLREGRWKEINIAFWEDNYPRSRALYLLSSAEMFGVTSLGGCELVDATMEDNPAPIQKLRVEYLEGENRTHAKDWNCSLLLAVARQYKRCVEELLHSQNPYPIDSLYYARAVTKSIEMGSPEILSLLLNKNRDLKDTDLKELITIAIMIGQVKCLDALLAHVKDPSLMDFGVLMRFAVGMNNRSAIERLVRYADKIERGTLLLGMGQLITSPKNVTLVEELLKKITLSEHEAQDLLRVEGLSIVMRKLLESHSPPPVTGLSAQRMNAIEIPKRDQGRLSTIPKKCFRFFVSLHPDVKVMLVAMFMFGIVHYASEHFFGTESESRSGA